MEKYENPVAEVMEIMPAEQLADDAQAAEIVTAEELIANLTGEETAVNDGDGGHGEGQASGTISEKDKFEGRIRAALANQSRQYRPDVDFAQRMRGIAQGMTDEQIVEALRTHQARAMHESDPEISEKAAAKIIEARESAKAPAADEKTAAYVEVLNQLAQEGWTNDMLRAFSTDEAVRADLAGGRTLRQAATAYLLRGAVTAQEQTTRKKQGVPTLRRTAAAGARDDNLIANMTDEEFARFSDRVQAEMREGRKVFIR